MGKGRNLPLPLLPLLPLQLLQLLQLQWLWLCFLQLS